MTFILEIILNFASDLQLRPRGKCDDIFLCKIPHHNSKLEDTSGLAWVHQICTNQPVSGPLEPHAFVVQSSNPLLLKLLSVSFLEIFPF